METFAKELRVVETATHRYIATVWCHGSAHIIDTAKRCAVALHKDFHFEVIDLDTLEKVTVQGEAVERGGAQGFPAPPEVFHTAEIWSPKKWVLTYKIGLYSAKGLWEEQKLRDSMLHNGAVIKVYDGEKGKYLPAIKKVPQ